MGLWNWVCSLFEKEDPLNVYKPKERFIFSYFDGEKMINADPMILWKRLMEVAPSLDIDIKLSKSAHKDAPKGMENAAKQVRDIFELKTPAGLDVGNCLGVFEVMDLFDNFMLWANDVKKKPNNTQTPATETLPSTESSSAENPPTPSSLDSGGTKTDQSTGKPNQSDSEQPSQ